MGILDDLRRITDASKGNPRPGIADALSYAADAAEQATVFQQHGGEAAAAGAMGAPGFNPFTNAAAWNAAIPGSGLVTTLTDTGQRFDGAGIYDIRLTVTLDGREPYEVVHRQLIAAVALANWQPGRMITLRVDPADETKVMLG